MQLWLTPKQAAPHLPHKSHKAIYEQIRQGTFPFIFRRSGRAIYISARDLGLPLDTIAEKVSGDRESAQTTNQTLTTVTA